MEIIISQGGTLSLQDIRGIMVCSVSESDAVFLFALTNCKPQLSDNNMILLFELALKYNRLVFAKRLLKYSPSLCNEDRYYKAIEYSKYELAEECLLLGTITGTVSLSSVLKIITKNKRKTKSLIFLIKETSREWLPY